MLPLVEKAYRTGKLSGQSYALLLDRVFVGEATVHALEPSGRHLAWGYNAIFLVGDGTHRDRG